MTWKPTTGDFDVDSGRYDIDYGDCQICGKKLVDAKDRVIGLCKRCAKRELDNCNIKF